VGEEAGVLSVLVYENKGGPAGQEGEGGNLRKKGGRFSPTTGWGAV